MEFLKRIPDGTITSDNVQCQGDDAYLHTGLYTFMMGPPEDRRPVEARFSYMWRRVDGQWRITHHHSSALPNAQAPVPAPTEFARGRVSDSGPAISSINDPAFLETLAHAWSKR
jgi:hypothetical protein